MHVEIRPARLRREEAKDEAGGAGGGEREDENAAVDSDRGSGEA